IAYSEQDSILYISSGSETAGDPIIAVAHLGAISSILALNNFPSTTPTDPAIDLSDGFDDTEKKAALKTGESQTSISGADVSAVTASGPYTLNPEATLAAGFVYVFGNDLNELRSQIQSARQQTPFNVSKTGVVISNRIPEETDLLQNAPNPFSDETIIRLDLSEDAEVKLVVYDVLGREVDVLRDEYMEANEYFIPFNPNNVSSGVYFVRLITDQKTETISITYIR
ncbi:MAG: T9SS type A sorting domain-containing protein, partial [Balneolaceae bacterium]|nr:T9SS type A sorting domain-containing protein [Balneolaceae bacterium]